MNLTIPTSIDEAVESYVESAGKFPEVLRITSSIDNFNKMVREVKPLLEQVAERYPLPWDILSNKEVKEIQKYSLTTFSNVYGSVYDKSGNLKCKPEVFERYQIYSMIIQSSLSTEQNITIAEKLLEKEKGD
ncbi:MAG: hypothetical protein AABW56_02845 [Nanoarchaeota archaeon]